MSELVCIFCYDRTWRERLFSWPWRPWVKQEKFEMRFPASGEWVDVKILGQEGRQ